MTTTAVETSLNLNHHSTEDIISKSDSQNISMMNKRIKGA